MKKTALFFLLVSSSLFGEVSENITFKNEQVGEMCFTTIDINVTEDWLNKEFELIEFNSYPNIRRQGFLMDMFYSNAGFGKSQWTEMDTRGVYMQSPGTIYLEPYRYAESGMQPGWLLRISIMNPASGESCK
tara:strand:+ start:773 stop:1168 length:396 start_codon:yes stop_codon:yes gene_type:complete